MFCVPPSPQVMRHMLLNPPPSRRVLEAQTKKAAVAAAAAAAAVATTPATATARGRGMGVGVPGSPMRRRPAPVPSVVQAVEAFSLLESPPRAPAIGACVRDGGGEGWGEGRRGVCVCVGDGEGGGRRLVV